MAEAGSLRIKILADVAEFSKGLEKVAADLKSMGTKVSAFGLAVGAGLGFAVKAAGESEAATAQLTVALRNQGRFSDEARDKILSYSSALQDQTGYSDEAITTVQSSLIAYGLQGDALQKVTRTVLDLSRAQGVDLQSSALLLGRAFTGETSMLSRYGITIDQNIPKSQKFAEALRLINSMYGGSAAEYRKTFLGQLTTLKEKFGDLAEKVGGVLIPVLSRVTTLIEGMVNAISKAPSWLITAGTSLAALAAATALVVGPMLILVGSIPGIVAGFAALTTLGSLLGVSLLAVGGAIAAVIAAVTLWISRWDQIKEASIVLLNYVLIDGINLVVDKLNGMLVWVNDNVIPMLNKIPGVAIDASIPLLGHIDHVQLQVSKAVDDAVDDVKKAGDKAAKALDKDLRNMGKDVKNFGGLVSDQAQAAEIAETERKAREIAATEQHFSRLVEMLTSKELRMAELRKSFSEADTGLLMSTLSMQQQIDLADKVQKLENEGKFNEAIYEKARVLKESQDSLNADRARNFVSWLGFMATQQDSKSKIMSAIGKAAAVTQATIDTYAAANAARKAMSGIPVVGPALAAAAVAATIAAGMANVAKIVSIRLAEGGIVLPRGGGVTATVAEAGSPEAVIPLKTGKAKKMLGDALGSGTTVVQFHISGQFLEANSAKWQQLVRESIIPEIRRFTDISPQGPFTRKRGRTV